MRLTSTAFEQGGAIPALFTCEGRNVSPQLDWSDLPKEAKSLALILHDPDGHDPDAPMANGFTHWVLYNIPTNVRQIGANQRLDPQISEGFQGKNGAGKLGYTGPCPPSGTHRYFFRLYALRSEVALEAGATREQLEEAMEGKVIEEAELMGTYTKGKAQAAR